MDLVVAVSLALLPLLPTGASYLTLDWPWALEVWFLGWAALVAAFLLFTPAGMPATPALRFVGRGYLVWLIAVAAAAIIGVLSRLPFDPLLLGVEARSLSGRLMLPMDQVADPLYPVRVGLLCAEGGLMFWLMSGLLRRTSEPARRARAALLGVLAGLALVSIIALVQYATGANLHEYWVRANPDLTRTHATLDDPNSLGSFLVLGLGLAAGAAWSGMAGTGRRARRAMLTVGVLASAALVTTVSRAGWAALMIAALVMTAWLPERLVETVPFGRAFRRLARVSCVIAAAGLLIWTAAFLALPKHEIARAPETPWDALVQTVDPRESLETILKRRHLLWTAGAHMIANDPLAGSGLGQFPRLLAAHPGSDGPENAHNYFLQVLAEAGAIGLAALAVWLSAIAVVLRDAIRLGDLARAKLGAGLSLGVLAYVLTWLTGHPLLNLSHQLWVAAVLAVGLAATGPVASVPGTVPAFQRVMLKPAAILVVLTVTLVVTAPRAARAIRSHAPEVSHAAGVYQWETGPPDEAAPPGARFRWTRARAVLREPVRGRMLSVPVYLARPDVPGREVSLELEIGGVHVPAIQLSRNGWHVFTYDLQALWGEQRWTTEPTVTLLVTVNPPVVPARVGGSADRRELGVGLGEIQWGSGGSR